MQTKPNITTCFVAIAISNGYSNPLNAFKVQEALFDFSDEDKKMWQYLVIKSFEADSNCRPLSQYLLENGIIPINDIVLQSATLQYIQLAMAQESSTKEVSHLNSFLQGSDLKLVSHNERIEEMMKFNEVIFNMCNSEQLEDIQNYMKNKNLQPYMKYIKRLEDLVI